MIEAHNLTHLPAAPWCEICVQARGKSDWHTQVKYDSEIPCVQMDFHFPVWCPEAQAKATVLTMVDMNTGYVGVLMVSGKSLDNFTARSSSSFDKLRAGKTRLRYDNEPAMRLLAEKIAAFRHSWSQSTVQRVFKLQHERRDWTFEPGPERTVCLDTHSSSGC